MGFANAKSRAFCICVNKFLNIFAPQGAFWHPNDTRGGLKMNQLRKTPTPPPTLAPAHYFCPTNFLK
jgi:hypothetical protein